MYVPLKNKERKHVKSVNERPLGVVSLVLKIDAMEPGSFFFFSERFESHLLAKWSSPSG